ncbi:hypothetical protein [Streptococcus thermophilus]
MAVQVLENFIAEWKPKYRKVMESSWKVWRIRIIF